MQLSFDPRDPRDVADAINTLRILGMIDAAVQVTINDDPTLSASQAEALQRRVNELVRPRPSGPPAQKQAKTTACHIDLAAIGLL